MRYDRSYRCIPKDWLFLLVLQFALPIAALVAAPFLPVLARARQGDPTLFWVALASALIGIVLLFVAKLPLYRQGRYFTFGTKPLPKGHRRVYRIAYAFIGASLLLILLLLAVLR